MYADSDSRGLISILEMDRPQWKVLRGACQIAAHIYEAQLSEFAGLDVVKMPTLEIQRKWGLEESISIARRIVHEIDLASDMLDNEQAFGKPFGL